MVYEKTPEAVSCPLPGTGSAAERTAAMLDLIFDGVIYDIGFCFDNWIGLYSFPGQMMLKGDLNLASYAAAN